MTTASRQLPFPSPQALGRDVRHAFRSNSLLQILAEQSTAHAGPFDGGCLIVAKALQLATNQGTVVRLVSPEYGQQTEHYGLRLDDWLYDASGGYPTAPSWIDAFCRHEHLVDRTLILAEGKDPHSEIPDDPIATKALATHLRTLLFPRASRAQRPK